MKSALAFPPQNSYSDAPPVVWCSFWYFLSSLGVTPTQESGKGQLLRCLVGLISRCIDLSSLLSSISLSANINLCYYYHTCLIGLVGGHRHPLTHFASQCPSLHFSMRAAGLEFRKRSFGRLWAVLIDPPRWSDSSYLHCLHHRSGQLTQTLTGGDVGSWRVVH